ncbi:hypothetical protein M5689_006372 [Euphorbia peplus]|nr:hypothetical protein M5689_006372 [Euphorbia peplus]
MWCKVLFLGLIMATAFTFCEARVLHQLVDQSGKFDDHSQTSMAMANPSPFLFPFPFPIPSLPPFNPPSFPFPPGFNLPPLPNLPPFPFPPLPFTPPSVSP